MVGTVIGLAEIVGHSRLIIRNKGECSEQMVILEELEYDANDN